MQAERWTIVDMKRRLDETDAERQQLINEIKEECQYLVTGQATVTFNVRTDHPEMTAQHILSHSLPFDVDWIDDVLDIEITSEGK